MEKTISYLYLSHTLSNNTPGYGGVPTFKSEKSSCMKEGASCNSQTWNLSNHIGSHADAPLHFCEGAKSIDSYPADFWVFNNVSLIEFKAKDAELIDETYLNDSVTKDTELVLFKTGFEALRDKEAYWNYNPGFQPSFATYVKKNFPNVRAVGFDFISLTSYQHRPLGRVAHKEFLSPDSNGHSLVIFEDLKLSEINNSPKQVIALPIRVESADGAPLTIIATE